MGAESRDGQLSPSLLAEAVESLADCCRIAWREGMMRGWSGNASLRLGGKMLITASGAAKGHLRPGQCVLMELDGSGICGGSKPSSEWRVHSALYAAMPQGRAILHTHPRALQALELALAEKGEWPARFLDLPLYEAGMWRGCLRIAPALAPGGEELARAAAAVMTPREPPCAVWLQGHGLCALGATLEEALCLTEELEHLAEVQLALLACAE